MSEKSEVVIQVPLLDQAAAAIKDKGTFQKDLTAQELSEIMRGVVGGLLAGQDTVKASVPTMSVKIENEQGTVAGSVRVEKPINATIGINLTLGNDTRPNKLRLVNLDVREEAGFAAKLALKAVNIKGKAEGALRDPNQALGMALGTQLEPKGVKLTGIDLSFRGNSLSASLKGVPLPRK